MIFPDVSQSLFPHGALLPFRGPRTKGLVAADGSHLETLRRALGREECLWAGAPDTCGPDVLLGSEAVEALLKAAISARFVVTDRESLAGAALLHGVPAFFLGPGGTLPTWKTGVPLGAQLASYAGPRTGPTAAAPIVTGPPLEVAVLSDRLYLPHLIGLVENLRDVHRGPLRVHVGALDAETSRFLENGELADLLELYALEELWDEEELCRLRLRPIADLAYSSKARLLDRALAGGAREVLYLDLDVLCLRSPARLGAELGSGSVLLFPQWNEHLSVSKQYGAFNAGMMLVNHRARRFLRWWAEICLRHYNRDPRRGYFVDQGPLDLAPVYFDDVRIYRGGDENVARWNLATLGHEGPRSVGSYHAAREDALGLFARKAVWDQAATFFSSLPSPERCSSFYLSVLAQQRRYSRAARREHFLLRLAEEVLGRSPCAPPPWVRRMATTGPLGLSCEAGGEALRLVRLAQERLERWRGGPCAKDGAGQSLHHLVFGSDHDARDVRT